MDLQQITEQVTQGDMTWLRNWPQVRGLNKSTTIVMDDFVEATHFPDGIIAPGLLLGRYVGGANDGKYGPYTPGAGNGLETAVRCVYSGYLVRRNPDHTPVAVQILGAAITEKTHAQVFVSKMPGTLNSGAAAHVIVPGDLPAAYENVDVA